MGARHLLEGSCTIAATRGTSVRCPGVLLGLTQETAVAPDSVDMIGKRRTEADRIRAKFGRVLTPAPPALPRSAERCDVASIEDLVELAARFGAPVMHVEDKWTGADLFLVDDGETRYRYRAEAHSSRFRAIKV